MSYRLALVEYLNTFPFYHGLHGMDDELIILPVSPSRCAELFKKGEVDIALCPVGALAEMPEHQLVGNYCIGADGKVGTVMLLSKVPLDEIKTVRLDPNSRTSNLLVQVLALRLWKRDWKFYKKENGVIPEACVMIGDSVFHQKENYPFQYDLAEAWKQLTGLPMVFAVWIAKPGVPQEIINKIDAAFEKGMAFVTGPNHQLEPWQVDYLKNNISFPFDQLKKQALAQYREWTKSMVTVPVSS